MKTEKFFAVIGLGSFSEANSPVLLPLVSHIWKRHADVVNTQSNCFVSGLVTESVQVAKTDTDSLPFSGKSVLITGERNPLTTKNPAVYRQAVIDVLKAVGTELGQTSAQLSFRVVDSETIDLTGQTEMPPAETMTE